LLTMGRRASSTEVHVHICLALTGSYGAGCVPTLDLCHADDAAKCGTIDEVPEQRTSRCREAAKRCTEDPCTQHWGNDDLGDTPEEPRPEYPLEDRQFRKALGR